MRIQEKIAHGITCDSVGTPDSIIGRAVCLSVHPGKMVLFPFLEWFGARYKDKYKFPRMLFAFDMVLIGVILGLGTAALFLSIFQPASFTDNIVFDATVAPRAIVSGAPSTLVIRYTNGTDTELTDARLSLEYPNHFLLQELSIDESLVEEDFIELGTIPVGGTGTVRVRGVMFGDVGGEQTFTSALSFTYLNGDKTLFAQKNSAHTFSPESSTLALSLDLPARLVAFQNVSGLIHYENTGEIDFPIISIEPEWPEGFSYLSADVGLTNDAFELPAIKAGASGALNFTGYLGDVGEEVAFIFHPSFTFDLERYQQETLIHVSPVVPPQVQVSLSVDKSTVQPGASAVYTLTYENTGAFTVSDVSLGIASDSPFFSEDLYVGDVISSLSPGASGTMYITVPLRWYINPSETGAYENLDLITRSVATYTLGDGSGQEVTAYGDSITSQLTTPVLLESFGRYATAGGDQLGRGPLPPRVDRETKYWIFWHLGGTTNTLSDIVIEGILPSNVVFTGRQSSSHNSGVVYDASTGTISWSSAELEPTLDPSSPIAGVAFEVSLTPSESQIGTMPTLLSEVRMTGRDARTGAFVSTSGSTVTTNLPSDLMATGKAVVTE
ncbi:MAG: hypothetical protein P8J32_07605 [bacterium]|nr:hypothetical protein [bacterium]